MRCRSSLQVEELWSGNSYAVSVKQRRKIAHASCGISLATLTLVEEESMKNRVIKKEHTHWWVMALAILFGVIVFFAYHLHAY
jgi:hypothetical protein